MAGTYRIWFPSFYPIGRIFFPLKKVFHKGQLNWFPILINSVTKQILVKNNSNFQFFAIFCNELIIHEKLYGELRVHVNETLLQD